MCSEKADIRSFRVCTKAPEQILYDEILSESVFEELLEKVEEKYRLSLTCEELTEGSYTCVDLYSGKQYGVDYVYNEYVKEACLEGELVEE